MKPETYKLWEEALKHFKDAETMLKNKNSQKAESEALASVFSGMGAILALSKELEVPDLSEIAGNTLQDFAERAEAHYTPKETVEWVFKTLTRFSDETPSNDKFWPPG